MQMAMACPSTVEMAEINTADAIRRMEEAAEIKFAEEKENTK